ncbi:MAG: hypothetical protein ONB05_07190 [candidate division KSB1 bacterium]|nr:hypothetical protein [candidate division KSB1 bacterium]
MSSRSKEKKFDAVKMMRVIRDKLSKLYIEHPELEEKHLQEIRKKYGIKLQKTAKVVVSS